MYRIITRRLLNLSQVAKPSTNVKFSTGSSASFPTSNKMEPQNITNKWTQDCIRANSTLKPQVLTITNGDLEDETTLYPKGHISHDFIEAEYAKLATEIPFLTKKILIRQITLYPEKGNADHYYLRAEELAKSNIYDEAGASYALSKKFNPEKYGEIVDKRIAALKEKYNKQEQERLEYVKKCREQLLKRGDG